MSTNHQTKFKYSDHPMWKQRVKSLHSIPNYTSKYLETPSPLRNSQPKLILNSMRAMPRRAPLSPL